jgi:tRNA A37 N6-isopentenylltransferase MiaA
VQMRSRNYAKHQLTWFRNLAGCATFEIAETVSADEIAGRVAAAWMND